MHEIRRDMGVVVWALLLLGSCSFGIVNGMLEGDVHLKHQSELAATCYFDQLPTELIQHIFRYCHPASSSLNYLIHHYEPDQHIVDDIVRARIAQVLQDYRSPTNKDPLETQRAKIISTMNLFLTKFPTLYAKSSVTLQALVAFRKFFLKKRISLKKCTKKIDEFVASVRNEALDVYLYEDSSHSKQSEHWLEFHKLYLEQMRTLIDVARKKIEKPPGWSLCVACMNGTAVTYSGLSVILMFYAASFEFEYNKLFRALGFMNSIIGLCWMIYSGSLIYKEAIPGFKERDLVYTAIDSALQKACHELTIRPENLSEILKAEREKSV